MRSEGLSAIELIVFVCELALGCSAAAMGAKRFGTVGAVVGFVLGFAVIPAMIYVAMAAQRWRVRRRS